MRVINGAGLIVLCVSLAWGETPAEHHAKYLKLMADMDAQGKALVKQLQEVQNIEAQVEAISFDTEARTMRLNMLNHMENDAAIDNAADSIRTQMILNQGR